MAMVAGSGTAAGHGWNGENRLISTTTRDDLSASVPRVRVEYAYDHQGRMVWKQISTNAVAISTSTLLWDGYNIIRETLSTNNSSFIPHNSSFYTWGLDLSGSLQGAGGVGGLLAEVHDGVPYFAGFDANGNVTEYLSTDGTIAAHYEYSPFGEIVVESSQSAINNPQSAISFTHRFSTKPWCPVTGLSEYLFRKYSPEMGRWMSRDPIEEKGCIALYAACLNNSPNTYDALGLTCLGRILCQTACSVAIASMSATCVGAGPLAPACWILVGLFGSTCMATCEEVPCGDGCRLGEEVRKLYAHRIKRQGKCDWCVYECYVVYVCQLKGVWPFRYNELVPRLAEHDMFCSDGRNKKCNRSRGSSRIAEVKR